MKNRSIAILFIISMTIGFLSPQNVYGFKIDVGNIVKDIAITAGTAALVRGMSGDLNSFINGLLSNNNAATRDMTKVVPIVSVDRKVSVGAAQVAGSKEQIDRVRAVVMLQADFQRKARIRVYVPSDSSNPLEFSRVQGVGTSAVIDFSL